MKRSKPVITHTAQKNSMNPAKFGSANGVSASGNKAILPNPAPPPKSSGYPVPPKAGPKTVK